MNANDFIGYPALFLNSENVISVEFPDLKGCLTQADTLEEAIFSAQVALMNYFSEKKENLPVASSLKSVQDDYPNSIVQLVAIDTARSIVKPLRTIKKTLTMPEWLNELAEKYHVNFSGVLREALIHHLKNLESISPRDRRMLND